MTTTMIYKPNYIKAEKKAYELLKLNGINKLPIKVKKLAKKFPNLKIKTYTWYANKWGLTIEDVCKLADSDEGCCWYIESQGQYMILYNDTVENSGRKRWTIAHELGHYMLKHNEITGKAIFSRSSLSDKEYDMFEKEANCFARSLLAPLPVISNLGKITIFDVANICEISMEAANNVIKFLNKGKEMGVYYSVRPIKMFSDYIYKMKNKHYCQNCKTETICEGEINFCPICKNSKLLKSFHSVGADNIVKYSGYIVDTITGRPVTCPRCENEEIQQGDFCKICGVEVINKCTNKHVWNGEVEWECGEVADGSARFCIKCGHETTYFSKGLLDSWEKEKKRKEEHKFESVPF